MIVKIRGKVRIKELGKVIDNTLDFDSVTEILYLAFTNSAPSSNAQPFILVETANKVEIQVTTTYSGFVWTGTLTTQVPVTIVGLSLYASFNGVTYRVSTVKTNVTLPAGSYTVEWVWSVDDPIGLVEKILDLGFRNQFSGITVTAGTCTNLATVTRLKNTVTLWFSCFETSTATYTTFSDTFDITSKSNTTYYITTSVPFAQQFTLNTPNDLLVPLTIIIT